jgi:hypothetical protein
MVAKRPEQHLANGIDLLDQRIHDTNGAEAGCVRFRLLTLFDYLA